MKVKLNLSEENETKEVGEKQDTKNWESKAEKTRKLKYRFIK